MEWTVVTVIIALIGLIAGVGAPIAKLIQSITKLTVLLDAVSKELNDAINKNHESHGKLWDHNKKQDELIQEHDKRITVLENK